MKIRTALSTGTAVALALSLSTVMAPAARAADPPAAGSYQVVTSVRLLDTRVGVGAPKAALGPGRTLTFSVTAGMPAPVSAVALTLTAVTPAGPGFLTAFAAGTSRPAASSLNFVAGQTVPNLVIAPVSSTGKVAVYNGSAHPIQVVADVHGYFVGGSNTGEPGTFVSTNPKRLLDTRSGAGAPKKRVGAYSSVTVKVAGMHGVPTTATAVAVNVVAVKPSGQGFITVYNGTPMPPTSTLNYVRQQDRANLMFQQIGEDGTITLFNGSSTSVDLVADISGYVVGGDPSVDGSYVPSTPFRVFDSRLAGGHPTPAHSTSKIQVLPAPDPADPTTVYNTFFKSIVVNVTATNAKAPGYLTTWNGTGKVPWISSTNFERGQNAAGSVIVPVNADGTISVYNGSTGTVDVVVDVSGYVFRLPPESPAARDANGSNRISALITHLTSVHTPVSAVPVSTSTN